MEEIIPSQLEDTVLEKGNSLVQADSNESASGCLGGEKQSLSEVVEPSTDHAETQDHDKEALVTSNTNTVVNTALSSAENQNNQDAAVQLLSLLAGTQLKANLGDLKNSPDDINNDKGNELADETGSLPHDAVHETNPTHMNILRETLDVTTNLPPTPNNTTSESSVVANVVAADTVKDAVDQAQPAVLPDSDDKGFPSRPVKRARTAYFIFTDEKRPEIQREHPGEGVATVARVLGQLWAGLSAEDKQVYQDRAALERERVAKDLQAWKDAGGVDPMAENSSASTVHHGHTLVYPLAKIRKICKLDPEVRGVSKEAILLITKAAELATAKLGLETVSVAQIQNRRKLLPEDVAQVCASREQFLFLREDIQDLARQQLKDAEKNKTAAKPVTKLSVEEEKAISNSKPLTAYFTAKPNK